MIVGETLVACFFFFFDGCWNQVGSLASLDTTQAAKASRLRGPGMGWFHHMGQTAKRGMKRIASPKKKLRGGDVLLYFFFGGGVQGGDKFPNFFGGVLYL